MSLQRIEKEVARSSLGTFKARAARRSVSQADAAQVVARAEAERRRDETRDTKSGG